MVFQTEKQAKENLERWRNFIYDKSIQVFYFKKNKKRGFKSELGYVAHGKFGRYVSKNPISYNKLTLEETIKRLSVFDSNTYY